MRYVRGEAPAGVEVLCMSDVRKLTGRNKSELLKDLTFPRPRGGSRENTFWAMRDLIDWATAPK